ncbi:MAG: hypothetical protein JW963_01625 [Anaerolineales bacterium]|nr:hypothetical protein [Anaerolineales bacterium]
MPSPFGEGQTDTPINHYYLGEVQTNPSPVSPKGEKLKPSSNKAFPWKTVTAITQQAPFPHRPRRGFGKRRAELARPGSAGRAGVEAGGGIGPSQTPFG